MNCRHHFLRHQKTQNHKEARKTLSQGKTASANAATNQEAIEPEAALVNEKEPDAKGSGASEHSTIDDAKPVEHVEPLRESESVESLNKDDEKTKVCDSQSAKSIPQQSEMIVDSQQVSSLDHAAEIQKTDIGGSHVTRTDGDMSDTDIRTDTDTDGLQPESTQVAAEATLDEGSSMAELPYSEGGLGTIDLVPVEADSGSDPDSPEL